jgi:hypothetical protein
MYFFNNTGIRAPTVDIDEIDVDILRNLVIINITGAFLCARRAFGEIKRQ